MYLQDVFHTRFLGEVVAVFLELDFDPAVSRMGVSSYLPGSDLMHRTQGQLREPPPLGFVKVWLWSPETDAWSGPGPFLLKIFRRKSWGVGLGVHMELDLVQYFQEITSAYQNRCFLHDILPVLSPDTNFSGHFLGGSFPWRLPSNFYFAIPELKNAVKHWLGYSTEKLAGRARNFYWSLNKYPRLDC